MNDFETVVKLNEKEIEVIGNLFAQYFVRCHSETEPLDCSSQSALLRKILEARSAQIIEAKAAGKLRAPEQPQNMTAEIFGGKPSEPVPTVDPDDVKFAWELSKDAEARGAKAVGEPIMAQVCTPGADIQAVFYRTSLLWMIIQMSPDVLERFIREGRPNNAVFRAAAKVPAEWMEVGVVRENPPFDVNEFLKLCAEAA